MTCNAEDTLHEAETHPDELLRARATICRDQVAILEVELDRYAEAREHAAVERARYATVGL